jgi:hypothetical protein
MWTAFLLLVSLAFADALVGRARVTGASLGSRRQMLMTASSDPIKNVGVVLLAGGNSNNNFDTTVCFDNNTHLSFRRREGEKNEKLSSEAILAPSGQACFPPKPR